MAHQASALKRKCPEETAGLCANGCGFHGAAATANMCSKCYREHVATTAPAAASTEPPEKKPKTTVSVGTPPSDGTCSGSKCPEPQQPEATAAAVMCANGCGFHGAAATANMCSKCYREHVAITAAYSVYLAPPAEKKAKVIVSVASSESDGGAVESSVKPPAATAAASRCAACRKKVGLLGFRCRCEGTFCSAHRYSEKHDCGFDHKTAGREEIAKDNPVVVADKMAERI